MMNLNTLLEATVEQHAERTALVFRPRYRTQRWTFAELGENIQRLASALHAAGVGAEDRVVLYGANSPHWVAAFFAVLSRGAVVVPLNPQSPVEQLQRIVGACEPKLLLCSTHTPWPGSPMATIEIERGIRVDTNSDEARPSSGEDLPTGGVDTSSVTLPSSSSGASRDLLPEGEGNMERPSAAASSIGLDALPPVAVTPDHLAEIVYTSGTTGEPKGVMLTHANLLSCVRALEVAVPVHPSDGVLSIVPLFHVYGQMAGLLYPLSRGCAVTYVPSLSSRVILGTLARSPAHYLIVVPEFLKTVMDRLDVQLVKVPAVLRPIARWLIRRRVFRELGTLISGGAPLSAELETQWRAFGFDVLQGYGLTETSPLIACNTHGAHRLGSVGKPIREVTVEIAGDGEILVRGPNVMAGYFRDERRTQAVLQDGWLKTDDSGKFDAEGFLYVFGRKKYMILGPGGENVFPEDLEAELNTITGVRDSAVVGIEKDGRMIIHAVLLSDRADGDTIVAQANQRLASHQRIMAWSLWPQADFPRSATRKVKKEEIIRWIGTQQAPRAQTATATPLTRLIAQVTRTDPLTITDDSRLVVDLHLDSLLRIELVSRIEEAFNREIAENRITETTTVGELKALLEEKQAPGPRTLRYPRWSLNALCRFIRPTLQNLGFLPWLRLVADLHIDGLHHLEHLPGPVIFMANHRSYLDGSALVHAIPRERRRRLAIAAAYDPLYEKFSKMAPIVELFYNTYPFGTRLTENIKPSLDYTGSLLDDGWNVLIFPEGQMNRSDQPLLPLRGGAGILAVEMQVPIVPMSIAGSERILPPGRLMAQRRGPVHIHFGAPLTFSPWDTYTEATRQIEEALSELLQRPSDETQS